MIHPQLITDVLRGERRAQRELYAALAPRAFRVAMRYVRERQDAEDIVQNAMARVFGKLSSFDASRGDLTGWAHRIAVNESLRHLQKRRSLLFAHASDDLPVTVDTEPLATDHLAAADVRQLILKLPEGYRAVFNLHEVEGYSHVEIAETLDITAATSRSQLVRAKRLLRKWLAGGNQASSSRLHNIAAL